MAGKASPNDSLYVFARAKAGPRAPLATLKRSIGPEPKEYSPTMAVCCSREGLSYSNFYAAQLFGKVAYHDFEGITIHADEGPRLLKSIGDRNAVILRNHGLLAWGQTLPQTFAILWTLQRACEIQMATFSMGQAIPVSEEIARRCTRDALQFSPEHGAGQDVFNALVRQVDRIDASYRN